MNKRSRNILGVSLGIIIVLVFFSVIFWQDNVFCYDTNIAHPNITDLASKVYFESTGHELTAEQIDCLRTGAVDEDMPIRWMNHFYDPIYNVGLKSNYLSAKEWSRASELQRDYSLGDQTWFRAIKEYQDGNEEQAFCTLGHILHLIADMSVPAHTRDDAHPTGDSYEQFVKYNWDLLYTGLQNVNMDLIYYPNLDNYFDKLANYSNNNFYSDDTIMVFKYKEPFNTGVEFLKDAQNATQKYLINNTINNLLCWDKSVVNWQDLLNDDNVENCNIKTPYILTDYTKHLLPQAVGYSAGVIKLFFEEVEKEHDFDLDDNKISFAGKMAEMLGWGIQKVGEAKDRIFGDRDVVKADEQVIKSVMGGDTENTKTQKHKNTELTSEEELESIGPESIFDEGVSARPVIVYEEPIVVEDTPVVPVNVPIPPSFSDTKNTEPAVEDTEDTETDIESTQPTYNPGGSSPTPPVPPTPPTSSTTTTTSTNTPSGDDDSATTSTPPGEEDGDDDLGDGEDVGGGDLGEENITSTLPTINIISHEDVSYINVSSTLIIVTSSEDVIQVYINDDEAELTPSSTWEAEINLTEGENIFNIYGENAEDLRSVTSSVNIILDTTAPEILSVETEQIEFTTPTIRITWTAEDAGVGVSDYDLEYKIDDGDWIVIVTSTTSTVYDFIGENLHEYNFRVKAYDEFGFVSDWVESGSTLTDWAKSVVINEIAWMGTQVSAANDEWLELYNNSEEDVDLTGWKILVSGDEMSWDNVGHIIPAGGYYLLERSDDDTVLEVEANAIYTLSGGFGNSGENIILMNSASSTIDQVDCSSNWFAGMTADGYRTMERLDSNQPGSLASNWQTSESVAPRGRPHGGDVIYGSPGYQNTSYWLLRGNPLVYYPDLIVDGKLVLTKVNSPYLIGYKTEIPAGLTVEIEPGVVLMGIDPSSYINIKGELILSGTVEDPIIFTSALDTNYIDLNLSKLVGDSPQSGDWSRIEIEENGVVQASNTKFLYGGQTFTKGNNWVYGTKWISQVLRNTGGTANLDNVEFNYNFIDSENPDYNTVVWTEAPLGYNASTTIENSILDSGYTSVNYYGQNNGQIVSGSLKNNQIKNFTNPESVIKIQYSEPELSNNILENNLSNYIDLGSWTLGNDATLSQNNKYLFSNIKIPTDKTLTIEPGVDVKLSGYIEVDGSLQANGEVGNPINFIPKDSYWNIMLFNNSDSSLSNVNITRGNSGSGLRALNKRGMVTIENSTVNFDSVVFMDARRPYNMIYTENSDVILRNSIISWTDDFTGLQNVDGIWFKSGNLHLDNTTFNRMSRGIEIFGGGLITMENMTLGHFQNIKDLNWWPATAFTF
ncbi:MAG: lamin tail domain-containing protein [Candidatus Magasanikbacteria bacterium]